MEETNRNGSLRISIFLTVGVYFSAQLALFAAFAIPGGFDSSLWISFASSCAAFHAFLLALLLLFRDDFRKESTGELLSSVNLANKITLVRISTLPTLMFLVLAAKTHQIRYPLLVLVVLIFVTDFLDGYVSRKGGEVTKVGRMMDSASDYTLLIVLTLVFRYYALIPSWFLLLVLARLSIQIVLVALLIAASGRIEPKTTWMGKVAVASMMVAYSVEVLDLILKGKIPAIVTETVEWVVAGVLIVSIFDKILAFRNSWKEANSIRRKEHGSDQERPRTGA